VKPGYAQRSDAEYARLGAANLFVFVEPPGQSPCGGADRTAHQARFRRRPVDEVYPEARVIRLVMDDLNTHTAAGLYEAFPPEEAHLATTGGA
jgi:hypothetical protein